MPKAIRKRKPIDAKVVRKRIPIDVTLEPEEIEMLGELSSGATITRSRVLSALIRQAHADIKGASRSAALTDFVDQSRPRSIWSQIEAQAGPEGLRAIARSILSFAREVSGRN